MHLLDLNLDVVHTILSYVDRKDMLELAATCASLHEPVMRCYAAYINTGNFKKRGALHEYCDYILCDARRSRYLTSVVIPSWPEAPSEDNYGEAERFAQLICRTERLTSVKCGMFPYGSQAVPVLLDAIASVATLTSVELALNDDDMLRVLSSLKSDPYQIVCWFQSPGVGTCIPRLPFLDLLAAFPHLHTLELINASPFLFEYGTSDEAISLPSVRELTVVQSTPSDLHPVARVFPNVETLHLSRPSDMMEPQVSFAWPSVNYLSTNYAVPITSHVRHVSIVTSPRCSPSSIAMLHCLVPLVIECYIDREYLQALSLLPDWSLRALQLRIVASLNEGLRQYLHDYLEILKQVPLLSLVLMLPTSLKGNTDHAHSVRAMCAWMAASLPSLSYVGIAWFTSSRKANCTNDSSNWFEVTARLERDGPSLVPLSQSEVDALYVT